jgi:uncharacterized protein
MSDSSFFSKPYNQVLATIAMVGVVVALLSYAYFTLKQAQEWNMGPTTISISGTGEVMAKPDIAQFSFSVRGDGADAAAAQEKSGTIINAITEYLKGAGIEEKDIKTESYNLSPRFKYEQKPCLFGQYCPPGEQIADGFEVVQTISVKVRNLDAAGTHVVEVGKLGATDISGISFTIDDEDVLKAQARELAIDNAQEKAIATANALNMRLGKMTGFYEEVPGMNPYMSAVPMMDARAADVKSFEAVNLPTGENTVTSQVTLTFIVK